jgi:NAD(P)-dependent dehydrogenase (short-subunit alcohol dehydrogenase family)
MDRLKGKRALITGGTSGIGLETAREFLNEGARVAVTGTSQRSIEEARKALGDSVLAVTSDASSVGAQTVLADTVRKAFGALDVLFINAGVADLRPLGEWDEAAFDRSIGINLKGPFFLLQALLPVFANPASVVFNASINAHIGMPRTTVYAATKAAMLSLVRTVSGELLERGIRVNAVSPGPIKTPLLSRAGLSEAELKAVADSVLSQIPLGRFGSPKEIAQAVVYLASDESAFVVGSELLITGGMGTL